MNVSRAAIRGVVVAVILCSVLAGGLYLVAWRLACHRASVILPRRLSGAQHLTVKVGGSGDPYVRAMPGAVLFEASGGEVADFLGLVRFAPSPLRLLGFRSTSAGELVFIFTGPEGKQSTFTLHDAESLRFKGGLRGDALLSTRSAFLMGIWLRKRTDLVAIDEGHSASP